ncbi:hypothetical protein ACLNGM_14980 [Aureimonas phyllosphaerae]|uniref:hypothetical protein n=1 Tax=Aureimonas phyllosphaerae TaxID=1166078 RepID=UPI003A5C4E1D
MTDLFDIIDRLDDATGPDREIDAAIDATLRVGKDSLPTWAHERFPVWRATKLGMVEAVTSEGRGPSWDSLRFTGSIEAATVLAERMLPDWGRMSYWNNCQGHTALVEDNANSYTGSTGKEYEATGATAAMALCSAVLLALADRPDLMRSA